MTTRYQFPLAWTWFQVMQGKEVLYSNEHPGDRFDSEGHTDSELCNAACAAANLAVSDGLTVRHGVNDQYPRSFQYTYADGAWVTSRDVTTLAGLVRQVAPYNRRGSSRRL